MAGVMVAAVEEGPPRPRPERAIAALRQAEDVPDALQNRGRGSYAYPGVVRTVGVAGWLLGEA
jgi:hypothetical protein